MGVFSQIWRCEQISHEPSPPCLTVRAPPILMPTIYCQLACTFSTCYAHSYGARSHLLRTDVTLDSSTDPASDKSRNPLSMTHEHTSGLGWVAQCHHFQRIQFFLSGRWLFNVFLHIERRHKNPKLSGRRLFMRKNFPNKAHEAISQSKRVCTSWHCQRMSNRLAINWKIRNHLEKSWTVLGP